MNKYRLFTGIISGLIVLNLPLLVVLGNFRLLVFDEGFYALESRKLGTNESFENPDEVIHSLTGYYKGRDELSPKLFSMEELSHLADVKSVINKANTIFYS